MAVAELALPRAVARARRPLPPRDTMLPRLRELLRPEPAAFALERSLVEGTRVDDVRVRLVEYTPAVACSVLYEVAIGGARHTAVIRLDGAIRSWAAGPETLRCEAPIARSLRWDAPLGALVHWYPHDPAMAVLQSPPAVLRALVGASPDSDAGARTLLYRPGIRAVLRVGDIVLKAYADARGYEAGLRGLRLRGNALGTHAGARVTAQPAIDGRAVARARAVEVAPRAGAMLRELHATADPGLDVTPPAAQLAAAACSAQLVATVAPQLADRAQALLARLELGAPAMVPDAVVSHGDFNMSQLLDTGAELVAVDFDEACLAAPACDIAAFAGNIISGRAGDLDDARLVLDALLEGYGTRPAELPWHLSATLLRRAASPFRRHKKRWPERTEAIIAAAEAVLRT